MGRSMYNFGKQTKEKARQQKQMEKASKRLLVKQQKAELKTVASNSDPETVEPGSQEEIVKNTV
jgi:hypothetical protein